jgi:flagellar hook protein FlgE
MSNITSIALSGMQAAQTRLDVAANNVANGQTVGYRRREVVQTAQPEGGTLASVRRSSQEGASLEADLVDQLQAKASFKASLAVFKTSDRMAGALLDEKA